MDDDEEDEDFDAEPLPERSLMLDGHEAFQYASGTVYLHLDGAEYGPFMDAEAAADAADLYDFNPITLSYRGL